MNDFTASNGYIVRLEDDARLVIDWPSERDARIAAISQLQVEALREFFQAEADERLGRWRWPENPDYVVYPCSVRTRVRVLQETGVGDLEWVDEGDGRSYEFVHAARAYFDAHPEPKPWHDAKPGEVWLLTSNGGLYIDEPAIFDGRQFVFCSRVERNTIDTATADGIREARRIWPEVSS